MNRPDAVLFVVARCLLLGLGLVAAVLVLGAGPAHADLRGTLGQAGTAAKTVATSTAKKASAPLTSVRHTVQQPVRRHAVQRTVHPSVRRVVATVRHHAAHWGPDARPALRTLSHPTRHVSVQNAGRTGIRKVAGTVKTLTTKASAATPTLHEVTAPARDLLDAIVREVSRATAVAPSDVAAAAIVSPAPTTARSVGAPPVASPASVSHALDRARYRGSVTPGPSGHHGGGVSSVAVSVAVLAATGDRIVEPQRPADASAPAAVDPLGPTTPAGSPTVTGVTGTLTATSGSALSYATVPDPLSVHAGPALLGCAEAVCGSWHLTRDPGFSPD